MDTYAVLSDFQSPYQDDSAVEVACKICSDLPNLHLILNGDCADFRTIGRWPSRPGAYVVSDFAEELERVRSFISKLIRYIKPRRCDWLDGNHEWRVQRLFMRDTQLVRLLGEQKIADATSIRTLIGLDKLKIRYVGEYPKGMWLRDENVCPPEKNVYVAHGYRTRVKSGYTATAELDDKMCSSIVGHTHKLALKWKKAAGNRRFFGAESGTLSILAEAGPHAKYDSIPFNDPDALDHQQGFMIVHHEAGHWFPKTVPIFHEKNGRAVAEWAGRIYKS